MRESTAELIVERARAEPVIVLVHGFAGLPAQWDRVVAGLGTLAPRVARVLLPGHGPGARPLPKATFVDVVDALAAEIVAPAVVVGYSLGGRLCLGLSLRHPDRVAAAVLIGAHPGIVDAAERQRRARWDEEQALALERHGVAGFMDRWQELPLFDSQRDLPRERLREQRRQRESHTAAGLAWAMRALGTGSMPPWLAELPACQVPLLFLCGERDIRYRQLAEGMTELAPRARAITVPGVGHNVVLEAPDAVSAALVGLDGPR